MGCFDSCLIDCPQCGGHEMVWERVVLETGEEHWDCPRCGAGYDFFSRNGTDDDFVVSEYKGIGVIAYYQNDASFKWWNYESEEERKKLLSEIMTQSADYRPAYYTYLKDGVWILHDLLTNKEMQATRENIDAFRYRGDGTVHQGLPFSESDLEFANKELETL